MNGTVLFHIHTLHDGPQEIHKRWLAGVLGTQICSECYSPIRRTSALSIQIDGKLEDVPLNVTIPIALGVIRLDLLSALDEGEFRECFYVGDVVDAKGKVIEDFFTFLGKTQLIIRGGPRSTHRECGSCGRQLYHPIGKRHVANSSLDGRSFYESQLNQIIASEDSANRVMGPSWSNVLEVAPLGVSY